MSSSIDDLLLALPASLRAQLPVFLVTLLCGLFIAVYTRNRAHSPPAPGSGSASTKANGKVELKYTFEESAIGDVNARLESHEVKVAKLLVHPIKVRIYSPANVTPLIHFSNRAVVAYRSKKPASRAQGLQYALSCL